MKNNKNEITNQLSNKSSIIFNQRYQSWIEQSLALRPTPKTLEEESTGWTLFKFLYNLYDKSFTLYTYKHKN